MMTNTMVADGSSRMNSSSPNSSSCDRPLWKSEEEPYSSGIVGLHEEIIDFVSFISPTNDEHWVREFVVSKFRNIITSMWNFSRVDVFGSFSTGLYLPTSDIDVVVFGKWPQLPLKTIEHALIRSRWARNIKVLSKATVPIIKFTDIDTGINVDVSFNMFNSIHVAEYVRKNIETYPCLRFLVLTLKQFLLMRDLNEVFLGGLSSYALILMCISFLKGQRFQNDTETTKNLGALLLEFLQFYGNDFNVKTTGIKVSDDRVYIPITEFPRMQNDGPAPMYIDDPISPGNNVTRSSYSINNVFEAFKNAYSTLAAYVNPSEHHKGSILSSILEIPESTMELRRQTQIRAAQLYPLIPTFYVPKKFHRRPDLKSNGATVSPSPSVESPVGDAASKDTATAAPGAPPNRRIVVSARGYNTRPPTFLHAQPGSDLLYLSPNPPPFGVFGSPVIYEPAGLPMASAGANQSSTLPNQPPHTIHRVFFVLANAVPAPLWYSYFPAIQQPPSQPFVEGESVIPTLPTDNVPQQDNVSTNDDCSTPENENSNEGRSSRPEDKKTLRHYKNARSASASQVYSKSSMESNRTTGNSKSYSSECDVSVQSINSTFPFSSSSIINYSSPSTSSTKGSAGENQCERMVAEEETDSMSQSSPIPPPTPPQQQRQSGGKSSRRRRRPLRKNGRSGNPVAGADVEGEESKTNQSNPAGSTTNAAYISSSNEECEEVGGATVQSLHKSKRRCSQLHTVGDCNLACEAPIGRPKPSVTNAWATPFKLSHQGREKVDNEEILASPNPIPTSKSSGNVKKLPQEQQKQQHQTGSSTSLKRPATVAGSRQRSKRL